MERESKRGIIVIPAYKPDQRLIDLVKRLTESGKNIVIVDDGSGAEYRSVFAELGEYPDVHILRHAVNMGKGRALKDAFNYILNEWSDAEYVITADADGQHTVEAIEKMADAYAGPQKIILGSRTFDATSDGEKVPIRSRIGNGCTTAVFRYLCGINISDTQTGLRLLPLSILDGLLTVSGERYEYETNCLLWCKEHEVGFHEVAIETIYLEGNKSSHFNPLLDSLRIYRVILAYSASSLLSVLVDYFLFFVCTSLGCGILAATYLARAGSCMLNFAANRRLVFRAKGNYAKQLIGYLLLVVVSSTISGFCVDMLHGLGCGLYITKMAVEICLYFFNYYIQRRLIFRS